MEQILLWDTYGIAIGCDGSLVDDGDYVYVLQERKVMQIDYFHGCVAKTPNDPKLPMCQMMDVEKSNFWAHELLGLRGFAAIRIINLQRRWRRLRAMEDVATKMATSGTAGG